MTDGYELEYRTTRLLYRLGYFSRRGVQLKSHFYPETTDITDIDSFGIKWNRDLSSSRAIAMCTTEKEKKRRGTSNRILILRGLMDLMNAPYAYLVMERFSPRLRSFSALNGIVPISNERLYELEKNMGLDKHFSSNDPNLLKKLRGFWDDLKDDGQSEMKRFYWFLISDFWFQDPNLCIKKLIYHVETLNRRLQLEKDFEKWMLVESIILMSVALLNFAFDVSCQPISARENYIETKMIEGISTIEDQERIRRAVYSVVSAKVKEITGKDIAISNDDIKIPPPDYTSRLAELVSRFIKHSHLAAEVPRFMDLYLYETVVWGRSIDVIDMQENLNLSEIELDFVAKLGKNVIMLLDPRYQEHDFLQSFLDY